MFIQFLRKCAGSTGHGNTIWYKSFLYKVVFMTQRRRVKLSANQRTDMWSRWKARQLLHEIGRAFGKGHVSIQFMLSQHGGIAQDHQHGMSGEKLGMVRFATSCNDVAQKEFDRAVALLHSFQFRQALDGFNAALRDDHSSVIV